MVTIGVTKLYQLYIEHVPEGPAISWNTCTGVKDGVFAWIMFIPLVLLI